MQFFLEKLAHFLPLLFGVGFIAPLTDQLIRALGLSLPLGVPPLVVGLLLGLAWGGYATVTRRWI